MSDNGGSNLYLVGAVDLQAAEGESKLRKFSGVAYNGGAMRPSGFGSDVVVDLTGVKVAGASKPILLDHDPAKIVGHSESIDVGAAIKVSGVISGASAAAEQVTASGQNGFPWGMSIGGTIEKAQRVDAGERVTVNGKTFTGPLTIVRQFTLKEVSFTALPADASTSARLAASAHQILHGADRMSERLEAKAEIERLKGINKALKDAVKDGALTADHAAELKARALDEKWDVDTTVLEILQAERPPVAYIRGGYSVGHNTTDLIACGFATRIDPELAGRAWGEQTVEAARVYAKWGMLDICAHALPVNGLDVPTHPDALLRASMSGVSLAVLSEILTTAPRRLLEQQLANSAPTWAAIARRRSATDFRTHRSVRLWTDSGLDKVAKDGEVKHTSLSEETTIGRLTPTPSVSRSRGRT